MVAGRREGVQVLLLKSTLGCAFEFAFYGGYMGGVMMVGIARTLRKFFFPSFCGGL